MKSILSFILALIMCFGASEGMISGVAQAVPEKETPIAKIANDDHVPYNYSNKTNAENEEELIDSVTKQVESVGGYVETYDSEDDYIKAQNRTATATSYEMDGSAELVKQVITVMTTATGSKENGNYVESRPIANAIVRIDGLPRYTDRNGQIRATLQKDNYVELYVEKEGYNPYIEIIDIIGEDKVVYMKQPSDDLEIYSVIASIDNIRQNVMIHPLSVFNDDENMTCLKINTNTDVDRVYFLREEEIVAESATTEIEFNFLGEKEDSNYYIYYEYNGIKSKKVELKIIVFSQKEMDISAFGSLGYSASLEPDEKDESVVGEGGMFGEFEFDFSDLLKLLFPNSTFEFSYDRRENKVEAILGYEHPDVLKDRGKWNKGKLDEFKYAFDFFDLKTWDDVQPSLSNTEKRFVTNKLNQFNQIVSDYKQLNLKKKNLSQSFKNQMRPDISLKWSVVGAIEGDLTQNRWASKIIGNVELTFEIGGQFLIAGVPMYWEAAIEINPGLSVTFNDMFTEDFRTTLDFIIEVTGKIGAGIGFNDLLSAGIYGKVSYKNEFELLPNPTHYYSSLTVGVYYKLCLLFLNFEGPIYDYKWTFVDERNAKSLDRTSALRQSLQFLKESDNAFIKNIYQQAQPQIVSLKDGRTLLVWLADDDRRTSLNRTNLAYRVQDLEGNWSEIYYVDDDGTSDFYPQLFDNRGKIFLAWQNTKIKLDGEVSGIEDIARIEKYGEIKVSEFNLNTNRFENKTVLTDNDYMDTYPTFAVNENDSDLLTIVWQTNSDNNILGTSGLSGIWYSVLRDGEWQQAKNIVIENKKIAAYSAGYNNDKLQVAALFDENEDFSTENNRELKVYEVGNANPIFSLEGDISSIQYSLIDNKNNLIYYNQGKIYTFNIDNGLVQILGSEKISRNFKLYIDGNNLFFTYYDMQESFRQSYVSIYNLDSNRWSYKIPITEGLNNVVSCDFMIKDSTITYAAVEEKQTDLGNYYDLILGEKELMIQIDITEATSYKVGENYKFFITLKNIGALNPYQLKFVIENTTYIIKDLESLYYGEEIEYAVDMSGSVLMSSENISIKLYDENNNFQDETTLILDRFFYSMNIVDCSFGSLNNFEITINNRGIFECDFNIIVKKSNNDDIIMVINSSELNDGKYYLELENDFYEDTEISFELVTALPNSFYNEIYYTLIKANKKIENSLGNELYQSLQYAKGKF